MSEGPTDIRYKRMESNQLDTLNIHNLMTSSRLRIKNLIDVRENVPRVIIILSC